MSKKPRPICPLCGERAKRSETRFGISHDCCGLWSWGNKPLADAETHAARRQAHDVFDRLWKTKSLSRGEAYVALSWATGWPEPECHMMHMPKEMAAQVPAAVAKIWKELQQHGTSILSARSC
ncbi:hypothetical protein IPV26_12280 [Brucella pituitosa]|uniref:Uncharacterized protein n=1 Tax=Brucella pituitosa TaxID=571256 RepID=A0ABS3K0I7_9HYPH|nr:hypothetical protein [Brucella pituitosa]